MNPAPPVTRHSGFMRDHTTKDQARRAEADCGVGPPRPCRVPGRTAHSAARLAAPTVSGEQGFDVGFGVERFEVIEFLAHADVLDGQIELLLDSENGAPLGGAVEL